MALQQNTVAATSNHIEALKAKHKNLSYQLDQELNHPSFSENRIAQLKRQKLILKEKIEGIRS